MLRPVHVVMVSALVLICGCEETPLEKTPQDSFGADLKFLKQHTDVLVLKDRTGQAQVAVAPCFQGRVMTSTAAGKDGLSFGWINRDVIAMGKQLPHITAAGGEERFWMGPEGGQFSIFFKKGDTFDLAHWQTPDVIDWGGWPIQSKSDTEVVFATSFELTNCSGTRLKVSVQRTVRLLDRQALAAHLGAPVPEEVACVGFETANRLTNAGEEAWTAKSGMLSVWILSMLRASPETTVVVPFRKGPVEQLGRIVNDEYFGKVPADRLVVSEQDGVLFFKADAKCRSKIGLGPRRATPVLGSYDAAHRVLTIAQYNKPDGVMDYVNSMWEMQEHPFAGDVANSYNDGPQADGKQMGQFYEIESSSPAAALAPQASLEHIHRTIHLLGDEAALDPIARRLLGASLSQIKAALK